MEDNRESSRFPVNSFFLAVLKKVLDFFRGLSCKFNACCGSKCSSECNSKKVKVEE